MYVVILVIDNQVKQTAIRGNANDAVNLAHQWISNIRTKNKNGFIVIDEQVKGKGENRRFAEIKLDDEPDKVKLYLRDREEPLFVSKLTPAIKTLFITFAEFGLIKLTEYIKSQKSTRR